MPAKECDNGKWKWGESGECIYDSEQEANDDNADYYRNIIIISGAPCSGKNTFVRNNKKRGDIVWDFDKIHSALTGEETHNHIEQVRKYIFSMRDAFYNDLENEKDLRVWIINSSPIRSVRNELAKRLNASIVYIKRTKEECLRVAENERPDEWKDYIENYFDRFEDIEENEKIDIIEVKEEEQKNLEPCEECVSDCDEGVCALESANEENKKEQKSINIWDNKFNDIMEKRIINIETSIETREQEDGKQTDVVVGYGSIYNSRSNDLGGFYEYIAEGAISEDVINSSDVRALINHNMDKILARSVNGNGTLKLSTDSKGLRYEFEIPDTTYGRDLKVNMANGNLNQSSFAFTVADDDWSNDDEGNNIRTINKIDTLYDISVVTYPAYSQAESDLVVAQRGLSSYKETLKKKEEEKDLVARSLASLKIELAKRK